MNKWVTGISSNHAEMNANQKWLDLSEARRSGREDKFFSSSQFTDYDMVGISAKNLPAVKEAINKYVTQIEKDLEELGKSHSKIDGAFQGEATQEALKEYINHVRDYCVNVTSQLLAYSQKISEILQVWIANQQQLASNINESGASIKVGTKMTDTTAGK